MIDELIDGMKRELATEGPTIVEDWQSINVDGDSPRAKTRELRNVIFTTPVPPTIEDAQEYMQPNLPWAEDHFLERVSGIPHNPPPSAKDWPYAVGGNKEHIKDGKYSHTYPERFWPKDTEGSPYGVRFPYGDLQDVVDQLIQRPSTRQAYLPVWFPEDTGVVHGERVPCTLGYHFLIRNGELVVTYLIRSCDLIRHFRDDLYMAIRLEQWMANEIGDLELGGLTMHIMSLHMFEADAIRIEKELDRERKAPFN